jgi:glycosyltransferase involved in cell wall biosynthesis
MTGMAISVVIPSYNAAARIRDAIDSVLRQTVLPKEIIVADDCSRDATVEVVAEIAGTAPVPVRTLRLPRNSGGPAQPINAGVQAASAELVAVLEQDDLMLPVRLSRSLDAAAALPSAGLICGRVRVRSPEGTVHDDLWNDGWRQFDGLSLRPLAEGLYRLDPEAVVRSLLWRNIVFGNSNAVFTRSMWQRVGGFDPRYRICADLDFNFKVARTAPLAVIDEVVCEYHWHEDSLYHGNVASGGDSPSQFEAEFIRMRHALASYAPATDGSRDWSWEAYRLLRSAWRLGHWRWCGRILGVLWSTGVLRHRVTSKLRRIVAEADGS